MHIYTNIDTWWVGAWLNIFPTIKHPIFRYCVIVEFIFLLLVTSTSIPQLQKIHHWFLQMQFIIYFNNENNQKKRNTNLYMIFGIQWQIILRRKMFTFVVLFLYSAENIFSFLSLLKSKIFFIFFSKSGKLNFYY